MFSKMAAAADRKRAKILGSEKLASLSPQDEIALRNVGVPFCAHQQACEDCPESCADGEDSGSPEYLSESQVRLWAKQDIDLSDVSLLSIARPDPFRTHALISTNGKTDWVREVSEESGSLAEQFRAFAEADKESDSSSKGTKNNGTSPKLPDGVWEGSSASRVVFHNSSHFSTSSDNANEDGASNHTLMLFPSFQLLTNIPAPSKAGTKGGNDKVLRAIWDLYLRGDAERVGEEERELIRKQGVRRWALPYRAVVLLCSHKKRDARCAIAANLLASALRHHAEEAGWSVDERNDSSSVIGHDSSSDTDWGALPPNDDGRKWRAQAAEGKGPDDEGAGTLGIFKISHIGGHKYSGNVIIYFPSGAGVWYGRVSPVRDSKLVFEKTIVQGFVIPEFLRAGINLVRSSMSEEDELVSGTKEMMLGKQALPKGSLVRW
ncbi:hypothetical protein OC845_004601 [Tilletia horrida]|nr:hypothetical protein OC845_004601 [Tilletia horrida]